MKTKLEKNFRLEEHFPLGLNVFDGDGKKVSYAIVDFTNGEWKLYPEKNNGTG